MSPFLESEAQDALKAAAAAAARADEACQDAGYGSEVLGAIEDARRALEYAIRLVEGKA